MPWWVPLVTRLSTAAEYSLMLPWQHWEMDRGALAIILNNLIKAHMAHNIWQSKLKKGFSYKHLSVINKRDFASRIRIAKSCRNLNPQHLTQTEVYTDSTQRCLAQGDSESVPTGLSKTQGKEKDNCTETFRFRKRLLCALSGGSEDVFPHIHKSFRRSWTTLFLGAWSTSISLKNIQMSKYIYFPRIMIGKYLVKKEERRKRWLSNFKCLLGTRCYAVLCICHSPRVTAQI